MQSRVTQYRYIIKYRKGPLLETSTLGPAEFRALVQSLEWVDLEEYDAVVKPAVG